MSGGWPGVGCGLHADQTGADGRRPSIAMGAMVANNGPREAAEVGEEVTEVTDVTEVPMGSL